MPCYQINTMTLEWSVKNVDLLLKTLARLGVVHRYDERRGVVNFRGVTLDLNNGTAKVPEYVDLNEYKREYSRTVIAEKARARRWAVKAVDKNKFRIRRS